MTRYDDELDEYGKKVLASLRNVPPIDPQTFANEKSRYLLQGQKMREGLIPQTLGMEKTQPRRHVFGLGIFHHIPLVKALVAVLVALVILGGSSITVFAAQSSLPGDPLYTIKSWSEDIRLSMTFSTKAKLNLTLDYTNRRMDEISILAAEGKTLDSQSSERYQDELDSALQLAAQLDDSQMYKALGQIKFHAENQGMTIEELINRLPPQAEPAIIHLQQRLDEQIELSTIGENDPQAFRLQLSQRFHIRQWLKRTPGVDESGSSPGEFSKTPMPGKDGNGKGNGNNPSDLAPGHDGQGNGQGQTSPGNGKHGANPTDTQEP